MMNSIYGFVFLFLGVSLSADTILSLRTASEIVAGEDALVAIEYEATAERDIQIRYMLEDSPWTSFGRATIRVESGERRVVAKVPVASDTPITGRKFKFAAAIVPVSGQIEDRLHASQQHNLKTVKGSEFFTLFPLEYKGGIRNPMKGFRPEANRMSFNKEYATVTRCYIRWNDIENSEADTIQMIKDYCNHKWLEFEDAGVKVIPRVYLDWNKEEGNEYWPEDMEVGDFTSKQFKARVTRLIHRLGECWDNDPRVAWIQVGIIGFWGEHHNPSPSEQIQKVIGDAFKSAFKNKMAIVRHPGEFLDYEMGIYWDSWAHIQQIEKSQQGAGIKVLNDATERWKTRPIEGEVAYDWGRFQEQPGDNPNDTLSDPIHRNFLIESVRDLHCSGLGWVANYDQSNAAASAGASEVQQAFGYRFEMLEFNASRRVNHGENLEIDFSVLNTGSAPFYENWPVELSLLDPRTHEVVVSSILRDIDIRKWMPGSHWSRDSNSYETPAEVNVSRARIPVPQSVPVGEYLLAISILDPAGNKPSVRFAIENYHKSGRHPLMRIGVGVTVKEGHVLASDSFDDLMDSPRLPYLME